MLVLLRLQSEIDDVLEFEFFSVYDSNVIFDC